MTTIEDTFTQLVRKLRTSLLFIGDRRLKDCLPTPRPTVKGLVYPIRDRRGRSFSLSPVESPQIFSAPASRTMGKVKSSLRHFAKLEKVLLFQITICKACNASV